jgi:RsiW-degrading membrane proteinase PrsW (M82 family)
VAANIGAILLSFVVLSGSIIIVKAISPSGNEDRMDGVIMFPIIATMLGALQWFVLRKRITKSGWWILATAVALGGGIALAILAVQAFSDIIGKAEYWNFQPRLLALFVLTGFFGSGTTANPLIPF